MFWFTESAAVRGLQTQLHAEQCEHEKTRRQLAIAQAEVEALAAVVARDRARVAAEIAEFGRCRAVAEGVVTTNERA